MSKVRRQDRACVKEAIAMLRAGNGFILVIDAPLQDRDRVEAALKAGEPLPSNLRIFASPEFQPARKTLDTMAKVCYGLFKRLNPGADPASRGLPVPIDSVVVGGNGKPAPLSPKILNHIAFGTDGQYGEQLHLLAMSEEVPVGVAPGTGSQSLKCSIPSPVTVDEAKSNFALIEGWAASQVDEVSKQTGWSTEDIREMVNISLSQLRKAWEQEGTSE